MEHLAPIFLNFLAHHWMAILTATFTFIVGRLIPAQWRIGATLAFVVFRALAPRIVERYAERFFKKKEPESCLGSGLPEQAIQPAPAKM